MTPEPVLEVRDAVARYGRNVALSGVSITVGEGEAVALMGANGAGKSTLAMAVGGIVRLTSGSIVFAGEDITSASPHRIARSGLIQVPEGRGVLRDLTVHENLRLGTLAAGSRVSDHAKAMEAALDRFPRLRERLSQPAGSLSGGEQQMLVLARALMAEPRLLVLDEPSLGLAPLLVRQTFDQLRALVSEGLSVLLVEQNIKMSLRLVDRAYVLTGGKVALSGTAAELQADERLQRTYLGGDVARQPQQDAVEAKS